MAGNKILVIGDAMLDTYHFGQVNRISPEAPVPVFLETGREKHVPGGAANVAVNIAAIGVPVELCSVVGKDINAKILKDLLDMRNVGTHLICETERRQTTNKLRFIGPNNQQILRVDTEDIRDLSYADVKDEIEQVAACIRQYSLVLLSDYKKGFLTEEIAQAFINIANANHIPVLVDVKDKNIQKYRNATLLKPNKKELSDLTGMNVDTMEEVKLAARELCRRTSCEYVLTTLGAEGMLLVKQDKVVKQVKSVAKEVYDVTGAGDTSIAYLAAELVLGKSVTEAMEISNYAAGLQVSKVGTSIVYPEEVFRTMNRDEKRIKVQEFADRETEKIDKPNSFETEDKELNFYLAKGLERLEKKRRAGSRIVFTNGCFDILHAGHITYLKKAKKLGDILVIGVNTDESVKRLKGNSRPVNPIEDRLMLLSALEYVDYVVPFQEDTPLELIKAIKPDVLVKGGDYQIDSIVGAKEVLDGGGIVRVLPFIEGRSTTGIIDKMQRG